MGVSKNRGTPQIIHFNRVFHYQSSILGYPYFWKPPYIHHHSKDIMYQQHLTGEHQGMPPPNGLTTSPISTAGKQTWIWSQPRVNVNHCGKKHTTFDGGKPIAMQHGDFIEFDGK